MTYPIKPDDDDELAKAIFAIVAIMLTVLFYFLIVFHGAWSFLEALL